MSLHVVVTGADGFLGRHTRAYLYTREGVRVTAINRSAYTPENLSRACADAQVVLHLAGINRDADNVVERGNLELAQQLVAALRERPEGAGPVVVAYAGTAHANADTPYGRGKRGAGEALLEWAEVCGQRAVEVRLPGLFGEHGRPQYNSFVATFAHAVAAGENPTVSGDRPIPLMHVHQAVRALWDAALGQAGPVENAYSPTGAKWAAALQLTPSTDAEPDVSTGPTGVLTPPSWTLGISEVLTTLQQMRNTYLPTGEFPALHTACDVALFNTLRAALWPAHYPLRPVRHSDQRGALHETTRYHTGPGQTFLSHTNPGFTRGNHFHFAKVERFHVLAGQATIRLRHVLTSEVLEFPVTGEEPVFLDMPALWTHSIENTGNEDVVTMFWTNEHFDPARPDTWADVVLPDDANSAAADAASRPTPVTA